MYVFRQESFDKQLRCSWKPLLSAEVLPQNCLGQFLKHDWSRGDVLLETKKGLHHRTPSSRDPAEPGSARFSISRDPDAPVDSGSLALHTTSSLLWGGFEKTPTTTERHVLGFRVGRLSERGCPCHSVIKVTTVNSYGVAWYSY